MEKTMYAAPVDGRDGRRPLNTLEIRVLDTARKIQELRPVGTWSATSIQEVGWPDSGNRYRAKELGICAALLTLRRRGIVIKYGRHSYRLAPTNT